MSKQSDGTVAVSRQRAAWVLAAMLAVYFCSYFQRCAIPGTIFNELQQEWNLSASAVVALGSVSLWVYGGMQLVTGITVDRFGGTRTLLVGGAILATGALLFPLSRTPGTLYASRVLTAVGDSFIYLCIIKELSLLFDPRRFAGLVSVVQFTAGCGGMLAMLPLERAVHFWGWRTALLMMGGVTGVVVGLNFPVLRKLNHFVPHPDGVTLRPLREILRNRRNWPIFIVGSINFPIYYVLQAGLGKKFIQDFAGLGSRPAATFTLIMMALSAGCVLLCGPILHQIGGRRKPMLLLAVGMLVSAVLLMLAGVLCHGRPWLFLTSYILLALSNIANPVGSVVIKELNNPRHVAQALALVNAIAYFGVAVILSLSGMVLDLFHTATVKTAAGIIYPPVAYSVVFGLFSGLALISLIATSFVHETGGTPKPALDSSLCAGPTGF